MAQEANQDRTYMIIISRLMEYLGKHGYMPGDKLPSEDVLAAELYFGRPALREALRVMELMGVIESARGRSNVYVMDMSKGMLSFFTVFASVYSGAFEGLSELRANIEVVGIESFIEHATELDIMELEYISKKHLEEKDDDFISCNNDKPHIQFHQALLKYSASPFELKFVAICICMQMLASVIAPIREGLAPAVAREFRQDCSHADIIEAIKAKDTAKAKNMIRRHTLYYAELKRELDRPE